MLGAHKAAILGAAGIGEVGDPLYNNVELLIRGDLGLVDLSKNLFNLYPTNGVTLNADNIELNGSSNDFNAYAVNTAHPTEFRIPAATPFCLEAVFQMDTIAPPFQTLMAFGASEGLVYTDHFGDTPRFYGNTNGTFSGSFGAGTAQAHLAVTSDGSGNLAMYLDGVSIGTTTGFTQSLHTTGEVLFGVQPSTANRFDGKIFALRITKGDLRYSGAFTPDLVDGKYFLAGSAGMATSSAAFAASTGYTLTTTASANDTTERNSSGSWAFASLLDVPMTSGRYVATFKVLALSAPSRAQFGVADGAGMTNFLSANAAGEAGSDTQSGYGTYAVNDEMTVLFDADAKVVTVLRNDQGCQATGAGSRQIVTGSTHYMAFQEYDALGKVQLIDNGKTYPGFTKLIP